MLVQRNKCWREGDTVQLFTKFNDSIFRGIFFFAVIALKIITLVKELMSLGTHMYFWPIRTHFNPRYARAIIKINLSRAENRFYMSVEKSSVICYLCLWFIWKTKRTKDKKILLRANLKIIFTLKIQEIVRHLLNMYIYLSLVILS